MVARVLFPQLAADTVTLEEGEWDGEGDACVRPSADVFRFKFPEFDVEPLRG